jgi:hypothetical protein
LRSTVPKLVIIDSITGCSRGSAFDENKKEFASPIYWLSNNNGRLFPGCTILLIHHANKTGGFRGSTAIRDAVDEVWGLRRPDKRQLEQVGHNARLIAVEKSRAGRDGSRLLMKLEDDLTFSLADYVETDVESANPASVVDRVLQRLRAAYPRALAVTDLAADPLCGGKVAAIRKSLQRLLSRGLIEIGGVAESGKAGRPSNQYVALLSRDISHKGCPIGTKSSARQENQIGQPSGMSYLEDEDLGEIGATEAEGAETPVSNWDNPTPCPIQKPSDQQESAPIGQVLHVSPCKERTAQELVKLTEAARDAWN